MVLTAEMDAQTMSAVKSRLGSSENAPKGIRNLEALAKELE